MKKQTFISSKEIMILQTTQLRSSAILESLMKPII